MNRWPLCGTRKSTMNRFSDARTTNLKSCHRLLCMVVWLCLMSVPAAGQNAAVDDAAQTLNELKAAGAARSSYLSQQHRPASTATMAIMTAIPVHSHSQSA